ncbi:MAG: hypothetical protein LV481_05505 [Methylacidiphilales bacterium]|nr:hypothetical protein [Candidatus Methylacidiphilales bacterium]
MHSGIGILLLLVWFIFVVIFLTILWRIAISLDLITRSLSDITQDVKKLADKNGK